MNSITEKINTSLENEKIPDFVSEELPKEEARKLTENDIGNLKKNYMLYSSLENEKSSQVYKNMLYICSCIFWFCIGISVYFQLGEFLIDIGIITFDILVIMYTLFFILLLIFLIKKTCKFCKHIHLNFALMKKYIKPVMIAALPENVDDEIKKNIIVICIYERIKDKIRITYCATCKGSWFLPKNIKPNTVVYMLTKSPVFEDYDKFGPLDRVFIPYDK